MNRRDTAFRIAAVKLTIFTVVSLMTTGLLIAIMGGFGLGSQTEYKAEFSTASELTKGDDVRIAGVVVGKVKDVEIYKRDHAMVTFKVKDGVPLTQDSRASIRFLNLIGDRYMSLSEGKAGSPRLRAQGDAPARPDHPGAQPDRAVPRVPAAVPGAQPGGRQQALAQPHPGAPG